LKCEQSKKVTRIARNKTLGQLSRVGGVASGRRWEPTTDGGKADVFYPYAITSRAGVADSRRRGFQLSTDAA
jgi:hypothetical protein